jgi:hypothetical protein
MPETKNLKPLVEEPTTVKGYNPEGDELKVYNQFKNRKDELLQSRRNVYGQDIDKMMRRFDTQYNNRVADIPASEMDPDQKPVAINNAFGKIQAALGILIDRNPDMTLEEKNPKFSAYRELMKGLLKSSWKNTNSLGQLKLSIFNCAKRGWFVGRTMHRFLKHDARFLSRVETKDGKETKEYETKEVTKMDDVAYININNFNAWIDEQTTPEDFYSTRDWMWREVWNIKDVRRIFPEAEFPNMKFVKEGGNTAETIEGVTDTSQAGAQSTSSEAKQTKKGQTEIFFYENQYEDMFIVQINGVMVVWEPLPQNNKRLSLCYGYWNLRGAESIYGIGVIEEMERNEGLIDRILNMTMRQLLLTIAPPGFYTGSEDPEDDNLKYRAGVLRRTMNPKDITFLQIPEGNQHGMDWISWIEGKQDAATGITKILEGDQGEKNATAFESGLNKEAGLKRLRLPLKSIQYALNWEFNNRLDLIKQVYSDFKVSHIADPEQIQAYLEDVKADPDAFFIENEGVAGQEKFYRTDFREMQLNLDQDEKGNFVESEGKKFFRIKPEYLAFEGDVNVDIDSILIQSEELEKADVLRMANIIIPVLPADPALFAKSVKQVLQAFNKDPRKWLPDTWITALATKQKPNPMMNAGEGGGKKLNADTIVPPNEVNQNVGLGNRFSAAFNAFKNPNGA